jgi:transcriptional regulator with PAS, ATPase and Fis domain
LARLTGWTLALPPLRHRWPPNVRELEKAITTALNLDPDSYRR